MKSYYSVIMNGYAVSLILRHNDWIDAFASLLESYNEMFETQLGADPESFYQLKDNNILKRSDTTFQIVEKTEKSDS